MQFAATAAESVGDVGGVTSAPRRARRWTGAALLGLAGLCLAAWLALQHRDGARQVFAAFGGARPGWVLAALALMGANFAVQALLWRSSFSAAGVRGLRLRDLLRVWFASVFANAAAPAAGPALFVAHAVRRGQSGARAAAGAVVAHLADFAGLLAAANAGLLCLYLLRGSVGAAEARALVLMSLITPGGVLLLGVARWRPEWLRRALSGASSLLARAAARLRRPTPLGPEWAARATDDFSGAATTVFGRPRGLIAPLCAALGGRVLDVSALCCLFAAFGIAADPAVVASGYAAAVLFVVVGVTPQGVGVVEGAMGLAYASLGVPGPAAAAVALAYRGLSLYLPLALGALAAPGLRRRRNSRP